jgi:glycosyltransferase involved in cell wall biosynthesis
MRIALLSYEYPPETGFGGIGTYAYYQARALAKLGHDVHVFAGSEHDGLFRSEHEGVKVTRLKRPGWLTNLLAGARQKRTWWFQNRLETAFATYRALRHELGRRDFDFIEAPECGGDAMVAATLLPIPVAIRFHSPARLIMNVYDTPKMDRELTAFAEQLAINQASVWTSCSRFLADEAALKMHVRGPIHVLPNGIDVPLFDRDEGIDVHARFGLPKDKVIVFFANRMEERKGIHIVRDMVFHCLRKYPHVVFAFAGRDLFGYMEKKILPWVRDQQLQSRFFYLGQLDLPAVRAVLKQSDIFLIPSLWENCPYSCIEAMTAGRAIVSSDCGGMPELIEDGRTGLLARNGDAASFIPVLERMIEDAPLRARLGAAARQEVETRLTDVVVAKQSVEIYQGWLAGNPVPAESSAARQQRAAAREVAELKTKAARLAAEIAAKEARATSGPEPARSGVWRRRFKKWYRKVRNMKNRAQLGRGGGGAHRAVLASTWDFPNPTHTFVYEEMQGLLAAGLDVRVFYGDRKPTHALAAPFAKLLQRAVAMEPVVEIQQRDLAHLQATRPGRIDAFLERVAPMIGARLDDLRRDELVLRACTFTRMAELFGAHYLHSYFFYDQSFMAMFASQVLGIPRGITAYSDHMLADYRFKLVPLHLQTADLVVATSRRAAGELLQIGGEGLRARLLQKPNGVDGRRWPLTPRPAAGPFELVSVSRLEPKKGLLSLVDAVALLAEKGRAPVVHLVGAEDPGRADSREYAAQLRRRIAERGLGGQIRMHGLLPPTALLPVLARASAFVAPYVETEAGDKDGIPTALLEAMSTGLPVIGSRAGAIPEAVTDAQEGLLVPPGDATALAAAIERLRADAALAARLGAAAAARFAREFDVRVTEGALHARVLALAAGRRDPAVGAG